MKPFTRILVPIDFMSHSAEAIRAALDVAGHYHAEVVLLYVHEPVEHPMMPSGHIVSSPAQLERMCPTARARLEAVRREVEATGSRDVTARLVHGRPAPAILELAEREPFDLIIMGTHGRTGVERIVLGSVAEEVMRRAPCPVLTIKTSRAVAQRRASAPRALA